MADLKKKVTGYGDVAQFSDPSVSILNPTGKPSPVTKESMNQFRNVMGANTSPYPEKAPVVPKVKLGATTPQKEDINSVGNMVKRVAGSPLVKGSTKMIDNGVKLAAVPLGVIGDTSAHLVNKANEALGGDAGLLDTQDTKRLLSGATEEKQRPLSRSETKPLGSSRPATVNKVMADAAKQVIAPTVDATPAGGYIVRDGTNGGKKGEKLGWQEGMNYYDYNNMYGSTSSKDGGSLIQLGGGKVNTMKPGDLERVNGHIKGNSLAGLPKENVDALGRGYDDQVTKAAEINKRNEDFEKNKSYAQRVNDASSNNTTWNQPWWVRQSGAKLDMENQQLKDADSTKRLGIMEDAAAKRDVAKEAANARIESSKNASEDRALRREEIKAQKDADRALKERALAEDSKKNKMGSLAKINDQRIKVEGLREKIKKGDAEADASLPEQEANLRAMQDEHDASYLTPAQANASMQARYQEAESKRLGANRKSILDYYDKTRGSKNIFTKKSIDDVQAGLLKAGYDPKEIDRFLPKK